jgi:hypothetical protein
MLPGSVTALTELGLYPLYWFGWAMISLTGTPLAIDLLIALMPAGSASPLPRVSPYIMAAIAIRSAFGFWLNA